MNIDPIALDVFSDNTILEYSIKESEKRNSDIKNILEQHIGPKWKIVLFLCIIFIFCIISLIIFGIPITTDNSIYNHTKAFFIIFIISIILLMFWTIIQPTNILKIQNGIEVYPKNYPFIPVDTTDCGTTIVSCGTNGAKNCCNSNYQCTLIPTDKKVYYLGTKLEPGKSFCLPKESQNAIQSCGTYTGKVVWTSTAKGQEWDCQCLYPDFFSGKQCLDQKGCIDKNGLHDLIDNNGKKWDPTNSPLGTPYDRDSKGNPVYKCNCMTYKNDPYTCHSDMCLGGFSNSDAAKFDIDSMSCKCDNNTTTKSNISGYCYPYANRENCQPHPLTGLCTYGLNNAIDTDHYFFQRNNKKLLTYLKEKNIVLIDFTDIDTPGITPLNIDNTLIKDAFHAFPIINPKDIPKDIPTAPTDLLKLAKTTVGDFNILFTKAVSTDHSIGYAKLCNSFYYNRKDIDTVCDDPFSNTGSQYINICKGDNSECGQDDKGNNIGICKFDINLGKTCECTSGSTLIGNKCNTCLKDGTNIEKSQADKCCSGANMISSDCSSGIGYSNCVYQCGGNVHHNH